MRPTHVVTPGCVRLVTWGLYWLSSSGVLTRMKCATPTILAPSCRTTSAISVATLDLIIHGSGASAAHAPTSDSLSYTTLAAKQGQGYRAAGALV
jgi:hypothetical protein